MMRVRRYLFSLAYGLLCALLISCAMGTGDPLDAFYEGSDSLFVAVGNAAGVTQTTILFSRDGKTWSGNMGIADPSFSNPSLNSIARGKNVLIAGGTNNLAPIAVIIDVNKGYVTQTAIPGGSIRGIAFANGNYFAAGAVPGGSQILHSYNGIIWDQPFTTGPGAQLRSVVFGDDLYFVGGNGRLYYSADAINWVLNPNMFPLFPNFGINSMVYTRGLLVMVGFDTVLGDGVILVSPDGVNLTKIDLPPGLNKLNGAAYGRDRFVAVGLGGLVMISYDGFLWAPAPAPPPASTNLLGIAYGPRGFVAVGEDGGVGQILFSEDGLIWTGNLCPGGIPILNSIVYGH